MTASSIDSFSVLLKCIPKIGGRLASAEVKISAALMQLCLSWGFLLTRRDS